MITAINIFKPGDKVYYPPEGREIFILEEGDLTYPVRLPLGIPNTYKGFTPKGLDYPLSVFPSIFHATKENCKKLTELYGLPFEEPNTFLDEHLANNSKVLCLVARTRATKKLPKYIWEVNPIDCFIEVVVKKKGSTYYAANEVTIYSSRIYPIAVDSKGRITYLN